MDQLLRENENLKQLASKYHKEMTQLHDVNVQHQNQIDTLLKFNQKLLQIIQKQLSGQKLKTSDISLQPISQKTENQSEMFQSQFSNVGNKFLQKRSMQLTRDPPMNEKTNRPEPLAIVERQEQMSIDVDVDGTMQKEDEEDKQVQNLLKQFKSKIKIKSVSRELSVREIEQKCRTELEELKQHRNAVLRDGNTLLQKISNFKQEVLELNEKEKLINLLREVEADDKAKSVIANYIKSV